MRNIFSFLDRTLRSVKFSVVLMLLIAIASIYGTIYPAKTPFDFNLYKTPYYIGLLFLFAINLSYCTVTRVYRQLKGKYEAGLVGDHTYYTQADIGLVRERLISAGYEILEKDYGLLARKGLLRYSSILVIHISLVMLLVFAGLSNLFNFHGTVNVHVGDEKDLVFDWKEKRDVKFPYKIIPHYLFVEYYPMDIKIELEDQKGEKTEIITREKKTVSFAGRNIFIEKADLTDFSVHFRIDGEKDIFKNLTPDQTIRIKLKAYADPVVKQFYCDLELKGVAKKRISVNDPLTYEDYKFFLIDTGKDDFGFDYVGFQITREPFINLIWLSSILLCLSLCLYPFLKESFIRVYKEEKGLKIVFFNEKNIFEEIG